MDRLFWQLGCNRPLGILKFSMIMNLRGHKQKKWTDIQRKWINMFIHFLCLCPLRLVIMLNFNISKVAYCIGNCRCRELVILKECINFFMTIDQEKNKLFSIVGSWEVAIKRRSPVLYKMIYNVHMHFLRRLRDIETRNTVKFRK